MKEKILELRAQGKTYNEIKETLGCSKGTISYHCGEGQKEKSNLRVIKSRKTKGVIIQRKVESFLRTSVREFKRGRATLSTNSSMSYEDAFKKLINNPYCYLTGRNINLEDSKSYQLDHIIPRSKSGNNELNNLGLACRDANQSKTDLTVNEYLVLCKEVLEYNGYKVTKK